MTREKSRPMFVPVEADKCLVSVSVMRALGMIVLLLAPAGCLYWTRVDERTLMCTSALVSSALLFTVAGICSNAAVTARNSVVQVHQLNRLLGKADQKEATFREIDSTEKPSV